MQGVVCRGLEDLFIVEGGAEESSWHFLVVESIELGVKLVVGLLFWKEGKKVP